MKMKTNSIIPSKKLFKRLMFINVVNVNMVENYLLGLNLIKKKRVPIISL